MLWEKKDQAEAWCLHAPLSLRGSNEKLPLLFAANHSFLFHSKIQTLFYTCLQPNVCSLEMCHKQDLEVTTCCMGMNVCPNNIKPWFRVTSEWPQHMFTQACWITTNAHVKKLVLILLILLIIWSHSSMYQKENSNHQAKIRRAWITSNKKIETSE